MAMTFQPATARSPFASIGFIAEAISNLAEAGCIGTRIIRDTAANTELLTGTAFKLMQRQLDIQFAELEAHQSKLLQ